MSEYLTLVFDASELDEDERLALCKRASAMSWSHALHERDDLDARADRLQIEAEAHAQEARTQRATVREIYQLVTKGTGEPGDWHGAEPVRALLEKHEALAAHNARLIEAGNALAAELAFWQGADRAPRSQAARDGWTFAVEEAPAASLVRLKEDRAMELQKAVMRARKSWAGQATPGIKAEWKAEALEELASDLALNADNARENGYSAAADVMQDAADYALGKAGNLRNQYEEARP